MIKIVTKTNTNWKQLKKDWSSKLVPRAMQDVVDSAVEDSQDAITLATSPNTNAQFESLSKITLNRRESGVFSVGQTKTTMHEGTSINIKEDLENIGGATPLHYTGKLYNSLKAVKTGKKYFLVGVDYGLKHNRGYKENFHLPGKPAKSIQVPKRDFISKKANTESASIGLGIGIRKSLRKRIAYK